MNCVSPFSKDGMSFPCGKCHPCLQRRASGWSFRLMKEEAYASSSYFITFTYDTEYVPITPNGFMSLKKSDFQKFVKRLRFHHKGKAIRYFCAGEYGDESYRPHYHAIMFNVNLADLIGQEYVNQVNNGNITLDGQRQFECPVWGLGYITIGKVAEASVGYTLKYMMKDNRVPVHARDDRVPEFQLMSKGLGMAYLQSDSIQWHRKHLLDRMYLNIDGGKKIAMPRYYKEKIYSKLERQHIGKNICGKLVDKTDLTGEQELRNFEHAKLKLQRRSKRSKI